MEADFKDYPKTFAPQDFWRQVKRTVYGQPVGDDQIAMIVDTIGSALQLQTQDALLDLACGNGALSRFFFGQCQEFLGVDYSEILIDVARTNFERPGCRFLLADVAEYVRQEQRPEQFTKVLCYGSFSFFPEETARLVLRRLSETFRQVECVFIGNLPDLSRHMDFYTDGHDHGHELKDPESKIGIWRSEEEFRALATDTGWNATFSRMAPPFYAAHYRYDVLLTRAN